MSNCMFSDLQVEHFAISAWKPCERWMLQPIELSVRKTALVFPSVEAMAESATTSPCDAQPVSPTSSITPGAPAGLPEKMATIGMLAAAAEAYPLPAALVPTAFV